MNIKPHLKCAGGKTQLLPIIRKLLPVKNTIDCYYEPFFGGGAVFFDLLPKKAVISDLNSEFMNVYYCIENFLDEMIYYLKIFKRDKKSYNGVRDWDRQIFFKDLSLSIKAARTIYLNKTCFNGLYRVNKKAQFNVSFGDYQNPKIFDEKLLFLIKNFFCQNEIRMHSDDFESNLFKNERNRKIGKNDFVYFDPPYYPISKTSNFTSYTKNGFSQEDHVRLKKCCDKLNEKGIRFLLSNSYCDFVFNLYKDYQIIPVEANRSINCVATSRGKIKEVFIKNY